MSGSLVSGLSVAFSPLLPWPVLAAAAGLGLALVLVTLVLRRRGGLWRTLALAALIGALTGPTLVREERQPIRDVAAIVVDRSPSQALDGRNARTDAALAALRHQLAAIPNLDVRVVESQAAGPNSPVDSTRLFDALNRAIGDVPRGRMAGAIMITDGEVHDVPADLGMLKGLGPIHVLLTGRHDERQRRLVVVRAPQYGLVGHQATIVVRVEDDGVPPESGPVTLTLRRDNGAVERQAVPVGADQAIQVPITHGGRTALALSVPPLPGELTQANNRAAVLINGVRDRLKVLLISGEPHVGERAWRDLLKSDPNVDLVHFTILRPPEKQDGTPINELSLIAFPIRELFEVKLSDFDLVIFDRYQRLGILPEAYLQNITDYVRRGGALLEASGPSFATPMTLFRTPLGQILPGEPTGDLTEQPFRPTVTAIGRRHPVTEDLPGGTNGPGGADTPSWGHWFRQVDVTADRGTTVMDGAGGRPLVILDRVGNGRVAQLTSDQMWLWGRGYDGGGPQADLLRRIVYWLMKQPELEENALSATVDGRRVTVTRQSLAPDVSPVTATAPSGAKVTLHPAPAGGGRASAAFDAGESGVWRIADAKHSTVAVVGAVNPPEFSDVRTTPKILAPVAAATGGGILWLADHPGGITVRHLKPGRAMAGNDWIGLRENGDYRVMGIGQTPLLPGWLILLAAVGGLFAAWRREGR